MATSSRCTRTPCRGCSSSAATPGCQATLPPPPPLAMSDVEAVLLAHLNFNGEIPDFRSFAGEIPDFDWACGPAGGADCRAIQQGSACYDPPDLQAHASYAFNDYFLRTGGAASPAACDFSDAAALTALNPSYGSCVLPSRGPPEMPVYVTDVRQLLIKSNPLFKCCPLDSSRDKQHIFK